MVNVKFYGSLRQFGTSFKIDAENTAEIIRALTSQIPKLREFIQKGYFTVRIAKEYIDNRYLEKGLFYKLKEGMTVHFTPVLKGSKRGGVFSVILGAALMVASIFVPGAGLFGGLITKGAVFGMGATLALGGVAQLLTPQPKMPAINEKEKKQSTSFSNLSNMAAQGRMVPLAYGRIRCGSLVISQGVQTLDVNIVEKNQNTGFSKG
ncbi:tail assembly protein [Pasteurella multocida]|uniref:Phage tail protein n=5 Tax=Pasteurella multocida TaxID=747 RepID=A0A849CQG9_PASMD|nr:tail assembly protein [Pasteurella multocida]AFI45263.1 tail assembly protein I [Pasteurella multocida subsp. multocida str. 3480]AON58436.1 phage tail protein [Pasteurella multocida]ARA70927.1 phage tail protein [Pasteurella multocida subsp. multocida]ARA88395.1 phage tail protein [Pasteurella multocida subsp. septica]AUK28631.1 phage tail protein [Pasteurella multocida]